MEATENQGVANYRDQLVGRMKSKYPDRNFDSIDGQNSPNSLEQSILEALDESDSRINDLSEKERVYNENTDRLTALFNNSPRSAVFLNTLAATGDPAAAIYKAYGKEAHDAFTTGNASKFIAEMEAEDAKAREENERYEAEKEQNLKDSFAELQSFGEEKGLDEQQQVDLFMRFYNILSDAIMGKYSRELFEMAYKADHYSDDIETARHEGEVAGRNANIKEKARKRQEAEAMPPALAGQGVRANESQPKEEESNPWML